MKNITVLTNSLREFFENINKKSFANLKEELQLITVHHFEFKELVVANKGNIDVEELENELN